MPTQILPQETVILSFVPPHSCGPLKHSLLDSGTDTTCPPFFDGTSGLEDLVFLHGNIESCLQDYSDLVHPTLSVALEGVHTNSKIYASSLFSDICRSPSPPPDTLNRSQPCSSTIHSFPRGPATPSEIFMPKKRRSLQTIFVPPFFHPALSTDARASPPMASPTQRFRSHSASASTTHFELPPAIPINLPHDALSSSRISATGNSPPSDLLDDDPFADLSHTPTIIRSPVPSPPESRSATPTPPRIDTSVCTGLSQLSNPRSPLANSVSDESDTSSPCHSPTHTPWNSPPTTPPPTPLLAPQPRRTPGRSRSSGQTQLHPAYTRPAFGSRPSLPSLSTLARMNILAPRVKRGRVGATLPAEPWDAPLSDDEVGSHPNSQSPSRSKSPSTLNSLRDSYVLIEEPNSLDTDEDESSLPYLDASELQEPLFRGVSSSLFAPVQSPGLVTESTAASVHPQVDPSASLDLYFDAPFDDLPAIHTEDVSSSPETSFPSTPEPPREFPSHGNYLDTFSHRSTSIYTDIPSTLDYDLVHALSRLARTPSPQPEGTPCSLLTPDESTCEFQPGTSAQTIRNIVRPESTLRPRTLSSSSDTVSSTSDMDTLSPKTSSSRLSGSDPRASRYSQNSDGAEFLSFANSSSDDEESVYLSASFSRSSSIRENQSSGPLSHVGESADTDSGVDITARLSAIHDHSEPGSSRYVSADECVDAGEGTYRGHGTRSNNGGSGDGGQRSRAGPSDGYRSTGNFGQGGGGRGRGRGRDDDDDDRDRRGRGRPDVAHVYPSTSEDEESSEDEEEEDFAPRATSSRIVNQDIPLSSDDDVPLAQKIPSALNAQRTIRRQVREEHDQRKRAKSLRQPHHTDNRSQAAPLPRLHGESISAGRAPRSSSPDAMPQVPRPRPRTNTMPSKASGPFSAGELTTKLLGVATAVPPLPSSRAVSSGHTSQELPSNQTPSSPKHGSFDLRHGHSVRAQGPIERYTTAPRSPMPEGIPPSQAPLRPMRSFHRPQTAGAENEIAPPVPVNSGARLGRSATSAGRRRPDEHNPPPPPPGSFPLPNQEANASLDRKRSSRSHSRKPSADRSRPSAEMERPPLPPLPLTEMKPVTMWQQRMFISNLQRFCQVELTQSSTARDVLEILQNQGALDNGAATGWMVWEVCQDFGMERPIRSFEVLTEVCNSWIADKTVNVLMAKKTLLAPKLSRAAIPSSSPLCSGFVQHEYKRGKWQKRWMELREHSIWLSKREGGKDQVNLCSLNNFDAYVVTRVSKAPKGFVFAVKSTDNISYFESTADYIHMFTCSEKEGENWLEKILLARSYVLHQERNVLSTNTAIAGAGAGLSRAGTRKHPRPSQPLVNFGQQIIPEPSPMAPVFEPGSLLAKRTL